MDYRLDYLGYHDGTPLSPEESQSGGIMSDKRTATPEQLAAASIIDSSVEGSDPGKYEVAKSLGLDVDVVDRVLSSYANWLRADDDEEDLE